ncbi:NrdH-redoxin [Candidatus Pacearchaeota archaeon]|nr:NrdH-redoxin [Candidatus Pacearchaeota archaeon]|tara:strand:- start:162 stop:344 length:183 start_codon:yes stop_codon:yes gene_type:complete
MATKAWLSKNGHSYTEKNISTDREYASELMGLGFRVTPVVVAGSQMLAGFNPNKLQEILA